METDWPIEKVDDPIIANAMETGFLPHDIYWAFQMLSKVKTVSQAAAAAKNAPTPGAGVMLAYAVDDRQSFMKHMLPRAVTRPGKEAQLKDDGRKYVEIFGALYDRIYEKYLAKRECPMCGRGLTKHISLFRRPKVAA